MLLSVPGPAIDTYRVEVSGWDSTQSFFVEQSELEWSEESGKQVALTHGLHKRTMIFVRLLRPTVSDRPSSVAYWAEHIATTPQGLLQFRLTQVLPRS